MKKFLSLLILLALMTGIFAFAEETTTDGEPTADYATESEAVNEPEGRLAGMVIGVDPGHQGKGNNEKELSSPKGKEKKAKVASGTRGYKTKIPEYETVMQISLVLRDALEAEGATVIMSRVDNNANISNKERAMLMNDAGCDLVLRIHCNGSTKHGANGTALYVRSSCAYGKDVVRDPKALLEAERSAAQVIIRNMCEKTGAKNLGVIKRDTYTMNNWSTVPIILVECGYLTNADEDRKLNDPEYQQKLADGMVEGIVEWKEARE